MSTAAPDASRTYAEWYVWARRNLTSTTEICHACAHAAATAAGAGADPAAAARHAAQNRVGPGWTTRAPDDVRAYAEWYDWCRSNLGVIGEPVHAATRSAMTALRDGGDAAAAAQAARSTVSTTVAGTPPPSVEPTDPAPELVTSPAPSPWSAPPAASQSPVPPPVSAVPTGIAAHAVAPPAYPAPQPGPRAADGRVVVPVWVTVLLGVGCGITFLVVAIYVAVLNLSNDPNVLGGAWFLITAGSLAFLASLVALIAVLRRTVWARGMAIVAGAVLCLTCVGLVIGVPVIVGAAVARREA